MGTFAVPVIVSHPRHPERRLTLDLLVDTGATWTLLPDEIVQRLSLTAPWQRSVTLASGERVLYATGDVAMQIDGEEHTTVFLAGPPGSLGLLGAVTLEQFGLAPDPVNKTLVPIAGLLAAAP